MTDKDEDETEESINKLTPGNILSFGSLNLLLTLNLEKHDIKKYKIKFDKLESLENLKFLKKHKSLWKRVTLSSPNNTLNILLHINKSSKKTINIGYVAFEKIEYKDEQEEFEKIIKEVTTQNGLFLTSCEVCPCIISIQLLLKYEEKEKKFILCGELESDKKEKEVKGEDDNKIQDEHIAKKEEKKEEEEKKSENGKKEDENPFTKIKSEIVAPADFNYIYFNYNDYVNGEFKGKITVEHLYEYFQTLKITTKSKIILNLEEENIDNNNIFRDIMSITDIFIFYDKNKLYELLKQLKIEEDNYNTEKLYEYHCREFEKKMQSKEEFKQHEDEKIKNYKAFLEKNKIPKEKDKNKNKTRNNESQCKQSNTDIKKENIYITQGENNKDNKDKDKESELNKINEMISNLEEKKEKEGEENKEKPKEADNKEKPEEKKEENKDNQEEKKENKDENKENKDENKENQEEKVKPINTSKVQASNDGQDKAQLNDDKKADILIREGVKRKSNSISKKNKFLQITPSPPQPLDKNDMFDYFKFSICDRDPQRRSTEKLLLLFDEFKKIFFVKYRKNNAKPNISDFDLKLYPQMNLRNMKEILEFKKFIKSKFSEYIKIFMGTLLSVVVVDTKEKIDDNTLFLGYLCATNTIKKIAEIQKYNLPLPKEKEFFYPSINKNEVEKLISKANQRKKEKLFILDGNSKKANIVKPYNPLLDKNLYSFFNSQNNKNFLKVNGFIKQNGEINYDPIYRETLGFSKFGKKEDNDINKTFQTTNKFLIGYKKTNKGYSIYNETKSSGVVLPPIEQSKRKPAEEKNGNTINEEENESGSGSGGSGSGSGSGDDSGSGSGSGD